MNRRALLPLSLLLAATGCAHAPMVVKHTYDFRTTALFKLDNDHSIRWMLGESRSVVLRRDR